MDHYFLRENINARKASPLERLAYIGERAVGALSYEPHYDINFAWHSAINLERLAKDCEHILQGHEDDILPELVIAGGSPGGARPKVLISYDEASKTMLSGIDKPQANFRNYLVKFSTMIDVNDNAEVEYAYALMAKDCGINMPAVRLFYAGKYGKAFGIERFDQDHNSRYHMHTLCGLLHADYRIPTIDYREFLKATWLLTKNREDVLQAFKRMIFNFLTHNRDDHSKNFAYLYKNDKWQLSPAYDLNFSSGIAGEHTMTIAGEGANPNKERCLEVAASANIDKKTANIIIDEVRNTVANWPVYASNVGVKKSTLNQVRKIINNLDH